MKKSICFVCLLLVIISLNVISCAKPPIVEEYANYKCYDYHLKALKTGWVFGVYESTSNWMKLGYEYRKINGLDTSQFVFAEYYKIFDLSQQYIIQNPENYVDVKTEWTIKKIEFYIYNYQGDLDDNEWDKMKLAFKNRSMVYSTSENIYIDGILNMWDIAANNDLTKRPVIYDDIPENNYFSYNNGADFSLSMRIVFVENKSLVWTTSVESYGDIYAVDVGKINADYDKSHEEYYAEQGSALHILITEVINTIRDEQNKK